MADQKISQLTELTSPLSGDTLPIVNNGETKRITVGNLIPNNLATTGSNTFIGRQTITGSEGTLIFDGSTPNPLIALSELHLNDKDPWFSRYYNDTFSTDSSILSIWGEDNGDCFIHNDSTSSIYIGINGDSEKNLAIGYLNTTSNNDFIVSGSLDINSLSGSWSFKKEGDVSFPVIATNQRTGTGEGLLFKKSGYQKVISTESGTISSNTVERMVIAGGDSYYSGSTYYGEGGDLYLWAGKGNDGGDVKVDAGEATDGLGGTVKVRGGYSFNGNGGFVEINAGDSSNSVGGNVNINAGIGTSNGVVNIVGNTLLTGSLFATKIEGTGSLYLQPDQNDGRLFEIYNTGATGYTDIHLKGNADLNFFGDDINYLKVDDNAQTVSIVGVNGVFVSSSLTVTGSVTLNNNLSVSGTTTLYDATTINDNLTVTGNTQVQGNTSVTGSLTVSSGSATMLGGDLFVSGNLQVLGSQTNVNIESHTVDIGDNIIQVNAYSPFQRYAGLSAYDSGSVGNSGSLLWDSTNDYWLFQNADGTSSKMVGVSGGTFGSEASLTSGTFPIATTGNTIGDSLLTYSGTTLSLNGKFSVDSGTGETKIQGNLNISYSGATMTSGVTSNVLFINSNDDLGFISSTDTTSVTDRLLGYNTATGNLEFSSLIDGGQY